MSLIFSRPREGSGPQTRKSTHGKLFGRSVLGGDEHSRNPDVYMVRYWFGPFRLHIMHRGDAGTLLHDHPWWFVTFPLTSYVEEVLLEEKTYDDSPCLERTLNVVKAFRIHYRPARYAHRILGPLPNDMRLRDLSYYRSGKKLFSLDQYAVGISEPRLKELRQAYPTQYGRKMYTLVLRGPVRWAWGFYTDWKGTWVRAGEYFQRNSIQQ